MLHHTKALHSIYTDVLERIPAGVRVVHPGNFAQILSILAEYFIIKLSAEIDLYCNNNADLINSNIVNCIEKDTRYDTIELAIRCFKMNICNATEKEAIISIKNLRNQDFAHNCEINTKGIELEHMAYEFMKQADSFLDKLDNYLKTL